MYPYLLKRKLIWRFVQLPDLVTTSQDRFLYYLSVWKIFSKNSFFQPSQGVSLSIADAKVDTFCKLTKHSRNFFSRFFNGFPQYADFQRESLKGDFREDREIVIYMLQNMFFGENFEVFRAMGEILHLCEIISAWWEKCWKGEAGWTFAFLRCCIYRAIAKLQP